MSADVNLVKAALRGQGMTLNDTKEQLLIATAAGRQAWQHAEPSYGGKVTPHGEGFGGMSKAPGHGKPSR